MTILGVDLGLADVEAAAARIGDHIRRTPLVPLETVPGMLLKAEHLQRGGSFKIRGAANAMIAGRPAEVVTGSSGNHGIAVATLGGGLGVAVTVVMTAAAAESKADALRALGATVIRVSGGVTERDRHARELAACTGALFIPSSDRDVVIAGQGTVGLEILADALVDVVFVPVGGGGLLAGTCLAAEAATRPLRIVGVEPKDARRYALSRAEGRPVEVPPPATVADGLCGQRPGDVTYPIVARRVDDLVGVTDEEIVHATDLLRAAGIDAEPTGGVALAGALRHGYAGTAVAIVSGGNTAEALSRFAVSGWAGHDSTEEKP